MIVGPEAASNISDVAPRTVSPATTVSKTRAAASSHALPASANDSANDSAPPSESPSALSGCSVSGCALPAATALHQPLCVDHFFARSYATLEHLEASHRGDPHASLDPALAEARVLLNACSIEALHISMRSENLSNLDRGRLLDILLWAGELSESFRRSARFNEPIRSSAAKTTANNTRSSAAKS